MSDLWFAILLAVAPRIIEKVCERILDRLWPSKKDESPRPKLLPKRKD